MSRVEENKGLLDLLGEQESLISGLGIGATDSYTLNNILAVLGDISMSLAVIADKISEEK